MHQVRTVPTRSRDPGHRSHGDGQRFRPRHGRPARQLVDAIATLRARLASRSFRIRFDASAPA